MIAFQKEHVAGKLVLNSWKEIATYLGRGVRTVQRWERELQLPVHRIGQGTRSPVFARPQELNFWISTSGVRAGRGGRPLRPVRLQQQPVQERSLKGKPLVDSRRLLANLSTLAQAIAENSVRQQQQAEILQARINQMRLRIK